MMFSLEGRTIIVTRPFKNLELIKTLFRMGAKIAAWTLLKSGLWRDQPEFFKTLNLYAPGMQIFWCDPTDKDAAELGLRNVEKNLGKPDFVLLSIEDYKQLLEK